MAEETLDAAIGANGLSAGPCKTVGLMLEGGKGWTPTLYIRLVQDYGLENEVKNTLVVGRVSLSEQHVRDLEPCWVAPSCLVRAERGGRPPVLDQRL